MLLERIKSLYHDIIVFPPYSNNFPSDFPTELSEILKISNGLQKKNISNIDSTKWILFPFEKIIEISSIYKSKFSLNNCAIFSEDDSGNLILLAGKTIFRLDPDTGEIQTVSKSLYEYWNNATKLDSIAFPSNVDRTVLLIQKFGTNPIKVNKEEIRRLLESEIQNYNKGSSDYIRTLCGYLFCVGTHSDIQLLEKAKYGINMDVGCMIDGEWIESLKNDGQAAKYLPSRNELISLFEEEIKHYIK